MGSHAKLRREAAESRGDRLADIAGVKRAVHKHESHLHKGKPETKLATGGAACVEGNRARGGRMDRKGKGGSKVNIVIAPQGGGAGGPPMMPPHPPMAAPPGAMPPGGAMPPPGAMPPQRPPMAPPGGMTPPAAVPHKRGGTVKKRAKGGDVTMTASAKGGEGRIEKGRMERRLDEKE